MDDADGVAPTLLEVVGDLAAAVTRWPACLSLRAGGSHTADSHGHSEQARGGASDNCRTVRGALIKQRARRRASSQAALSLK
jgi:hypothetical protein